MNFLRSLINELDDDFVPGIYSRSHLRQITNRLKPGEAITLEPVMPGELWSNPSYPLKDDYFSGPEDRMRAWFKNLGALVSISLSRPRELTIYKPDIKNDKAPDYTRSRPEPLLRQPRKARW